MLIAPSHTALERFWDKVAMSEGCWLWTGCIVNGYGQFSLAPAKRVRAHRFSYALTFGPIRPSRLVCHKCDNRRCVRPDHLYEGTASDNTRDSVARRRHHHLTTTHCKRGHEFTPENTYHQPSYPASRRCRACAADATTRRYAK